MNDLLNYISLFSILLLIGFIVTISFVFMENKYLSILLNIFLVWIIYFILNSYNFNIILIFSKINTFLNTFIDNIKELLYIK